MNLDVKLKKNNKRNARKRKLYIECNERKTIVYTVLPHARTYMQNRITY